MTIQFILDGEDINIQAEAGESLAGLLFDSFNARSIHPDCKIGVCGKCVVLMNGLPVNSCLVPAFRARGAEIVSYDGFASTQDNDIVRRACNENSVSPCGFCEPAVFLLIGSLIDRKNRPSDLEITEMLSSVVCHCTPPQSLIAAALAAISIKEGRVYGRAR